MKTRNWRSKLEEPLRKHLELQIRGAHRHKKAYRLSQNPSNSQIWVAIANLSNQLFELNLRMNILERAIKEVLEKNNSKKIVKKTSQKIKKRK